MCAGSDAQVGCFRHAELHPRGQFVAGDARREFAVAGMLCEMPLIHLLQERAGGPIRRGRDADRHEVPHGFLGTERRRLERGRQESGAPVVRAILRHAARIGDGDEGGQILVLAAERVGDPRAEAGKTVQHEAGREKVLGGAVRVGLAGERMDERDVVGQLREMRDHVGDHLAGLRRAGGTRTAAGQDFRPAPGTSRPGRRATAGRPA